MTPTIPDKATALVRVDLNQLANKKIYAIWIKGEGVVVRRYVKKISYFMPDNTGEDNIPYPLSL